MTQKRVHVYISGRVQGVCFRQATLQTAGKYGVKGWVRNTHKGQVEAVFEGDEESVDNIIEWCKKGPTTARVKNIEIFKETYQNEFHDFRIKHTF